MRVLVWLKVRAPEQTPQALLRVSVWRLVVSLLRAGLRSVRRAMGEVGAVLLLVGVVGRMTGRSAGVEGVVERVVAGLVGGQLLPGGVLSRARVGGAGGGGAVLQ